MKLSVDKLIFMHCQETVLPRKGGVSGGGRGGAVELNFPSTFIGMG